MSERSEEVKEAAAAAAKNKKTLEKHVAHLSGASRRDRQVSAAVIALVAKEAPDRVVGHLPEIIDALNRPEAQTRWEALDALSELIESDARTCEKAIPEAETALFDEDSGPLRLAAVRFLCTLGATTETRSEKVWPLLDEAIQCFHGDLEFMDMLSYINAFSCGKLSPQVKKELGARIKFDAENGKGQLQKRMQQIQKNLKKK